MKKFLFVLVLILVMSITLSLACLAEETDAVEIEYTENEQIIADGLSGAIQKGDELFANEPWWDAFSTLVKNNMTTIVTSIAGAIAFFGSLLLWKSRTKIKEYISGLGKALKEWFSSLNNKTKEIKESVEKLNSGIEEIQKNLEKLKNADILTVDALEDMIKLSGADEGKKDIYLIKLEKAKSEIENEK